MFTGWIRQAISIDVRLALPFPSRGGWRRRGRRGVRFMADPTERGHAQARTPLRATRLSVKPVGPSLLASFPVLVIYGRSDNRERTVVAHYVPECSPPSFTQDGDMDFFSSEDEERRVGCVDQGGAGLAGPVSNRRVCEQQCQRPRGRTLRGQARLGIDASQSGYCFGAPEKDETVPASPCARSRGGAPSSGAGVKKPHRTAWRAWEAA